MHDWTLDPGLVARAAERRRRHGRSYIIIGIGLSTAAFVAAVLWWARQSKATSAELSRTGALAAGIAAIVGPLCVGVLRMGVRLIRPPLPRSSLPPAVVKEHSPARLRLRLVTSPPSMIAMVAAGALSLPLAVVVGPFAEKWDGPHWWVRFWLLWPGLLGAWAYGWYFWAARRVASGRHDLSIDLAAAQFTLPRTTWGAAKRGRGKPLPLAQLRVVQLSCEFAGGRKNIRPDAKGTHFWWSLHFWIGPDEDSAEEALLVRGLDEHTARSLADLIANAANYRILAGEPGSP